MDIDRSKLSPMMQQYFEVKDKYPGCILFFRLGDFYEMFFDDAITVSKALELTLTGRDCGMEERAPMCGVPYHAADMYIRKLIDLGFRVAVCEQLTDPAETKGIVVRDVIRVVTPGTITESSMLDDSSNNYICSVYYDEASKTCAVASADISTGEAALSLFEDTKGSSLEAAVINELSRCSPAEIIFEESFLSLKSVAEFIKVRLQCAVTMLDKDNFSPALHRDMVCGVFGKKDIKELGISEDGADCAAVCALFGYIQDTQKTSVSRFTSIELLNGEAFMGLDLNARRNLELTETLRSKEKKGSLLWVLDSTKTSMGRRMLKNWIEQPLRSPARIIERHGAVEALYRKSVILADISELLENVYDLERLMTKVMYKSANPRDLRSLAATAKQLPALKQELAKLSESKLLTKLCGEISDLSEIVSLVENAITEDPPISAKDGGVTVPYGTVQAVTSTVPTKTGYTFAGWYTDEGLTQAAGSTVTIEGNTTLYAKWTGDTVKYTIFYIKEVYNANGNEWVYESAKDMTGTVGTTVYAGGAPDYDKADFYGYEKDSDRNGTSTAGGTGENTEVVIAADGSTVLKVYYKLIRYKLVFNANQGTITIDGRDYTGSSYSIDDIVLGQDMGAKWPASSTEIHRNNYYFDGWTGGPSTYITKQYELVWNHVKNANSNHVMTYTASWDTSSYSRNAYYWLQQANGTWEIADEYTQIGLNTNNLGAKEIAGYKKHNGDATRPSTDYPASGEAGITSVTQNNYWGGWVRDDNRIAGNSYTYYEYDGHLYRERRSGYMQGWSWIEPDEGLTRYSVTREYHYNFYYDRESYDIYFKQVTKDGIVDLTDKTVEDVLYEADIKDYEFIPDKPANTAEYDYSDYTWGGWYADAKLTQPYTFDTMPGNDLILYSKWVAPTFTVTFEANGGTPVPQTQTVEKYKKAVAPETNPTKAGYVFEGWYTSTDYDTLYDWNTQITANTTIYAKWSKATLSYTVRYVDGEGAQLAPEKTVTNPNFDAGEVVTEDALAIPGYRPNDSSKTLTLSDDLSQNVIIFVYSSKAGTTSYTVKYILDPEEYPGDEIAVAESITVDNVPGDTASVIEMAAAVNYTLLAEHTELNGLEFHPDAVEKTLVLTANAEQNVLTFYYSSFKTATVTVHFVDMDGNAIADDDVQLLKVGKHYALARSPIQGWEFNKAVVGTEYGGTEAEDEYKITNEIAANGLTFTLFYQKKVTITAKSYSKQYDGEALLLPDALDGQVTVEGIALNELQSVEFDFVEADVTNGRKKAGVATVTPKNAVIAGEHVDNYYTIRYISGRLEVTKINVTIRIEPDRWTGAPYTGESYLTGFTNPGKTTWDKYIMISHAGYASEYLDDIVEMVTGLSNVQSGAAAGLGYYVEDEKDVDDYTYTLDLTSAQMPNGSGNYSVSLTVRPGRLQILPKEVTITTGTASKEYDGTPLTKDEASITGLVAADEGKVTVTATGTITDPGSTSMGPA